MEAQTAETPIGCI